MDRFEHAELGHGSTPFCTRHGRFVTERSRLGALGPAETMAEVTKGDYHGILMLLCHHKYKVGEAAQSMRSGRELPPRLCFMPRAHAHARVLRSGTPLCRSVNEDVLAAIVKFDESKSSYRIEE